MSALYLEYYIAYSDTYVGSNCISIQLLLQYFNIYKSVNYSFANSFDQQFLWFSFKCCKNFNMNEPVTPNWILTKGLAWYEVGIVLHYRLLWTSVDRSHHSAWHRCAIKWVEGSEARKASLRLPSRASSPWTRSSFSPNRF